MTDHELDVQLRAWYDRAVPAGTIAPAALRASVLEIPRASVRSGWLGPNRRLALVAAAAAAFAAFVGVLLVAPGGQVQPPASPSAVSSHAEPPPSASARPPGWSAAGSMTGIGGPDTQGAVLMDGTVLAVGRNGAANRYDATMGTWQAVANAPGEVASLVVLSDGTVLATGSARVLAAQRYDATAGRWTATGGLAAEKNRNAYTATVLGDGRVLVAGGVVDTSGDVPMRTISTAELYDPATGRWTETGRLLKGRWGHTATLLRDGRVLVVGGITLTKRNNAREVSTAEVYDPGLGTWTPAGDPGLSLSQLRAQFASVLLRDGTVLVIGTGTGGVALAERYDPTAGSWSEAGALLERENAGGTLSLLADGRVLLAGGGDDPATATAEIFDPGTGAWTLTASLPTPRDQHVALSLVDGSVLVCGGEKGFLSFNHLSSCDMYTP
jgi:hypothetical protein